MVIEHSLVGLLDCSTKISGLWEQSSKPQSNFLRFHFLLKNTEIFRADFLKIVTILCSCGTRDAV